METLQHQIVSEWARFADVAEQVITDTQRAAVRDIQDALGGNLNRALTIARTEQMRAYRNASLRSYQDNHELLRGWRWLASPSRRTCPVCLAMDGTEHGLDKPFASHIRCRCVPVPVLHNAPPSTRKTGAAWFAEQDEATQRAMLGPGKQQLYAEGKLTLADLVGVKEDAQWGRSRYQRSMGDALAAAAKREAGVMQEHERAGLLQRIQALQPHEVMTLGMLNKDIVQHWASDLTDNLHVVLTGRQRQHYLERHPDMSTHERALIDVIFDPDEVHRNKKDKAIAIFYRYLDETYALRAVVLMQRTPNTLKHSIITYRVANRTEVEGGVVRRVWEK